LQRVIEVRIHGKPTRARKRIGMLLSDLIGKEDYACLKKEHKIGISGEIRRWKMRMRVENLLIGSVHKKKI